MTEREKAAESDTSGNDGKTEPTEESSVTVQPDTSGMELQGTCPTLPSAVKSFIGIAGELQQTDSPVLEDGNDNQGRNNSVQIQLQHVAVLEETHNSILHFEICILHADQHANQLANKRCWCYYLSRFLLLYYTCF